LTTGSAAEESGVSEIKETAEHEVREVARGRRWYTPFAVISGVAAVVWALAALIIVVALVIWLVL
jgi:hypothetical protein